MVGHPAQGACLGRRSADCQGDGRSYGLQLTMNGPPRGPWFITSRAATTTRSSLSAVQTMHCDHKLGLSLGVLIVGFAAALCFPRHRDREVVSLELDGAADLDQEIALLPIRAYTEEEAAPEAEAPPVAPLPESAAFEQPVPGGATDELELFAGPPEPIATGDAAGTVLETAAISPDAVAAPQAMEEYTVRPGDTLSGLAARFLGSHARYLELFEANRDVLSSPDDLQPRMTLRIPGGQTAIADAAPGGGSQVQNAAMASNALATAGSASSIPEKMADETSRAARFKPAGRRPFIPAASIPAEREAGDSAGQ